MSFSKAPRFPRYKKNDILASPADYNLREESMSTCPCEVERKSKEAGEIYSKSFETTCSLKRCSMTRKAVITKVPRKSTQSDYSYCRNYKPSKVTSKLNNNIINNFYNVTVYVTGSWAKCWNSQSYRANVHEKRKVLKNSFNILHSFSIQYSPLVHAILREDAMALTPLADIIAHDEFIDNHPVNGKFHEESINNNVVNIIANDELVHVRAAEPRQTALQTTVLQLECISDDSTSGVETDVTSSSDSCISSPSSEYFFAVRKNRNFCSGRSLLKMLQENLADDFCALSSSRLGGSIEDYSSDQDCAIEYLHEDDFALGFDYTFHNLTAADVAEMWDYFDVYHLPDFDCF